jgi:endoglucanase
MQHFVNDDGFNVFRLPVCWQYLVNNNLGGTLDATNSGVYDELVGACLQTGAYCVVDIHNYARWNNQIIGQSGGAVTSDQFASVWYQM